MIPLIDGQHVALMEYSPFFLISKWLPIPVFPSPAPLLKVEIEPEEPLEIQEGQSLEFTAKLLPKMNAFGTGELSETESTLDIFAGYFPDGPPTIKWTATIASQTKFQSTDWRFTFRPGKGTGTYEIKTEALIPVKESVTDTSADVAGEVITKVKVTEGLRILSPVKDFAYPVGMPISLETTIDANPEEWKKITWTLNGKPWKPAEAEPPAFLVLEEKTDHILKAQLTIKDSNGQEIELTDSVKFEVKPVVASLKPHRQVFLKDNGAIPLDLSITLGKTPVDDISKEVDWAKDLKAKVEKVEWSGSFEPDKAGSLIVGTSQLKAEVKFAKPGALTALATITVKVWSVDPTKPYDETFAFQASRADIWALEIQLATYTAHLPTEAIENVGRSFNLSKADLIVNEENYTWSPETQNPRLYINRGVFPISLATALLGGDPATCRGLTILWSCKDNNPGNKPLYQPLMQAPGSVDVSLATSLDFAPTPGKFPLFSKSIPVDVFAVKELVDTKVSPASFVAPLDGYESLVYSLKSKKNEKWGQTALILNDAFQICILDVAWNEDGVYLGLGNPFQYPASKREPTTAEIFAYASGKLIEVFPIPAKGEFAGLAASATVTHIRPRIEISIVDLFNNHVIGLPEGSSKAFIHYNLDNDCEEVEGGEPVHDYSKVMNLKEDDLVQLKVTVYPLTGVSKGKVTLSRTNENIRVWVGQSKSGGPKLSDNDECSWDLSDADQSMLFSIEKDQLYVEGFHEDSSALTLKYTLADVFAQSKTINISCIGVSSGWQPLPERRKVIKKGFPNLIDCQWSVLDGETDLYNCIGWSIGSPSAWIGGVRKGVYPGHAKFIDEMGFDVDETGADNSPGELKPKEVTAFYVSWAFTPCEADDPECEVVYFSKFHAARKSGHSHGDGMWNLYQSKLSRFERIEHVLEQISGTEYGAPSLFFKKSHKSGGGNREK